jgi:hypothetical protein
MDRAKAPSENSGPRFRSSPCRSRRDLLAGFFVELLSELIAALFHRADMLIELLLNAHVRILHAPEFGCGHLNSLLPDWDPPGAVRFRTLPSRNGQLGRLEFGPGRLFLPDTLRLRHPGCLAS